MAVASCDQEKDEEEGAAAAGDAAKGKKARKKKKKGKEALEGAPEGHCEGQLDGFAPGQADGGYFAAPMAPLVASDDWQDVSEVCDLAMEGMSLGEMLESPTFRLFDSMSAIEIMDPKMDSGFNSGEDMTLERAEALGIVSTSLTYEEMVRVWDEVLMFFLLWLDGHTIVQTVFSCLYFHDLQRFVQPMPAFGAFADALLAACRAAREAVMDANIYDDEDFLPSLFNISRQACVSSTQVADIAANVAARRAALAGEPGPGAARAALRLAFVGEYMLALTELTKGIAEEKQRASVRQRLERCLGLVEQLGKEDQSEGDAGRDALRCFDASYSRSLLVPGPPRIVEAIRDRSVVLARWTSHLHELLLCTAVPAMPLVQILDEAVCYKGEPNVLPRSIAQASASDAGHIRRLVLESLEVCLFPAEALQHCKKAADLFLAHSESMFLHLTKLANANRARRFRRLAHVFADLNALQHEAYRFDNELQKTFAGNLRHPRPCWLWVMEHSMQAMIAKLCLGFTLELYDEAEFHMIYWYVDYLFGLRIHNLNDLYHAREQPAGGAGKKKGKSKEQQQDAARRGTRPRNPPLSLLLLEATQFALRGLFRLLAFCLDMGCLGPPAAAVEGLPQRFVLRFRALESFSLPHLPSYQDFEASATIAQARDPRQAAVERRVVLEAAQASFAETAQILERITAAKDRDDADGRILDAARGIKRVVVANQLALTQLTKMVATGVARKVVVATTYHPYLVSVQVQAAAS